jgi:hypothetical protein
MTNFFMDFWKILKLDGQVLEKIRDDKEGLWIALRLFLIVAVIITSGGLVSALTSGLTGLGGNLNTLETRLEQLSAQKLPGFLETYVLSLSEKVGTISTTLEQYQPPLGKNVSYTIRSIGKWLSAPLALLGGWFAASLAVFLVAKALKGKGDIREHVSIFLLGFAPSILLIVSSFSFLFSNYGWIGYILNFAAFIWSLIIVVVGLKVVHGISSGKAFVVLLVAFLLFFIVLPMVVIAPFSIVLTLFF